MEVEDSTLPKILELKAVAEKKESTIVQLENVASEFEKSGAEWRQDAAKFENVQVTYKEFEKVLMTAVCDKLKTFMEDHNKGNQGQILNTEQANVLGTEITQVEDLKKKCESAFRLNDVLIQDLDAAWKPVGSLRTMLGEKIKFTDLFSKPLFLDSKKFGENVENCGKGTLEQIAKFKTELEDHLQSLRAFRVQAPGPAYEGKIQLAGKMITQALDNVVAAAIPESVLILQVMQLAANVALNTIHLLGHEPQTHSGRQLKLTAGKIDNYKWGFSVTLALALANAAQMESPTKLRDAMKYLKDKLVDPPAPNAADVAKLFDAKVTVAQTLLAGHKATVTNELKTKGGAQRDKVVEMERTLHWQSKGTATKFEEVEKAFREIVWRKTDETLAVRNGTDLVDSVKTYLKNDFDKTISTWDLQKDQDLQVVREEIKKALKQVDIILTEAGVMTVITTESDAAKRKVAMVREESFRKERGVTLQEVHHPLHRCA